MNLKHILLAKIAFSIIGIYFCILLQTGYWFVGLIFGGVVLLWHAKSLRELLSFRSAMFLVASTFIYALMVTLRSFSNILGGNWPSPLDDQFVVAVGTVLLAIAHALFLKASWKRVGIAIPCVYGSWYFIASPMQQLIIFPDAVMDFVEMAKVPLLTPTLSFLLSLLATFLYYSNVYVWQGAYLLFMFGTKPRFFARMS